MSEFCKSILPILLLTVIISSLSLPVSANSDAKIVVEPRIIDIPVSSIFTIDIWIRDLGVDVMQEFDFTITWDPALMEYVSHMDHVLANDPNWSIKNQNLDVLGGSYRLSAAAGRDGILFNEDLSRVTLTFHCLGEGSSPINIQNSVIFKGAAGRVEIEHEVLKGAVTQEPGMAVGGVATPVNKLAIIAPYVLLAGLIIAVSVVYVIKRRKD